MSYTPPQEILDKYAKVFVDFALNGGEGLKPKEVVFLQVPECAKPLLIALRRQVLKAGAFPIIDYVPDDIAREGLELANEDQLDFFPGKFLKGKVDEADHLLFVIAETDKHELEGIDPKKIMRRATAMTPYKNWRVAKENEGKLTWTLGLYGTEAMAKEANMTLQEYWDEIIKACYLDEEDPVKKWKEVYTEINRVKDKLNDLKIEKVHVKSDRIDITIGLGKDRKWLGGSGRNIPSFEIFISPDCRMTQGYIFFDQPLYRYGNMIKNVYLEFKDGLVVNATAEMGEDVLKEMIATEGANKVGEFSLTDGRLSRVTKFMGETLYDENVGGQYGNTHIALGSAYKDSYTGDPSKVKKEEWDAMGYNDSIVHTDIISTENRVVTAFLENGEEKVIYKDGGFKL